MPPIFSFHIPSPHHTPPMCCIGTSILFQPPHHIVHPPSPTHPNTLFSLLSSFFPSFLFMYNLLHLTLLFLWHTCTPPIHPCYLFISPLFSLAPLSPIFFSFFLSVSTSSFAVGSPPHFYRTTHTQNNAIPNKISFDIIPSTCTSDTCNGTK